jgi:hypothetical protein
MVGVVVVCVIGAVVSAVSSGVVVLSSVTVVGDAVDVTDAEGSESVTGGSRCNAKQISNF